MKKRVIAVLIALALLVSCIVFAEEENGVRAGSYNIGYEYARNMLAYQDISDSQILNDIVALFNELGTYEFSSEYASYANVLFCLSEDNLDQARRELTSLEKRAQQRYGFITELENASGMYSLEELGGYISGRLAEKRDDKGEARGYYLKYPVLDADQRYRQLTEKLPPDFDEAWVLESEGDIQGAIEIYRKLVNMGYSDVQVRLDELENWYARCQEGEIALNQGKYDVAIRIFSELKDVHYFGALERFESCCAHLYALALTEEEHGEYINYRSAAGYYEMLANYNYHDSAEQLARLSPLLTAFEEAVSLEESGNREAALEAYGTASEFKPAIQAHERLKRWIELGTKGDACWNANDYTGALANYAQLQKEGSSWGDERMKQMMDTIYGQAVNTEPNDVVSACAYYSLLTPYGYPGADEGARRTYIRAKYGEIEAHELKGEYDSALQIYGELIAMGDEDAEAGRNRLNERIRLERLAQDAIQAGNTQEVIDCYFQLKGLNHPGAAELFEKYAREYYDAAQAAASQNDNETAWRQFSVLANYDYLDSGSHMQINHAVMLANRGDYAHALSELQNMIDQGLGYAEIIKPMVEGSIAAKAEEEYAQGKLNEAFDLFTVIIDHSVGDNQYAARLDSLLHEQRDIMRKHMMAGDNQDAMEIYNVLTYYRPDMPDRVIRVDVAMPEESAYKDPLRVMYNSEAYRALNPDMEAWVLSEWKSKGVYEGRRANYAVDPVYYLEQFREWEVKDTEESKYFDALLHYWNTGMAQDVNGSAEFNVLDYMMLNPDVARENDNNIYKCLRYYVNSGYKSNNGTIIKW